MDENRRRLEMERQARAKAIARRRRKRRQRKILIVTCVMLMLCIILGGAVGIAAVRKNNAKKELRAAGIVSMEQADYESAIATFDQALAGSKGKIGSFEADVLSYRGEAEYKQRDYEAAKHTFTLLIEQEGKKEAYERMLCLSELELGNYDAALSYGFANARVYNKMAVQNIEQKEYDAALACIEKGLAEEGEETVTQDLLLNQAVAYEYKGDFKKALELLESYVGTYGADEEIEREITFLKTRQGSEETESTGE